MSIHPSKKKKQGLNIIFFGIHLMQKNVSTIKKHGK